MLLYANIHSAKHSITLEAYIFWPDTTGTTFAEALAERALGGGAPSLRSAAARREDNCPRGRTWPV